MKKSTRERSNLGRGQRVMERLEALARFTEEPGRLTRRYLTKAHRDAAECVAAWIAEAGLAGGIDALGSVHGRLEGATPGLPALIIGSHIDTVIDGGKYDGNLGVLAAIAVAEELRETGRRLPFALEVYAFGDEEGVRYPGSLATSMAVAGRFDPAWLQRADDTGMTMGDAMRTFGGDPAAFASVAHTRDQVLAYFELHIEQGPQLEAAGLPLGVVTGISGSMRSTVTVTGEAGHAGTVPMSQRHDALAAAAEMALAVERLALAGPDLVATVGRFTVEPGAVNVIPGRVRFTVDLRSPDDQARLKAARTLAAEIKRIARRRGVRIEIASHDPSPAMAFDAEIIAAADAAIRRTGATPLHLHSGAGHDALAFRDFCPAGMLFVRCLKGISHNPAESITTEDADLAVRALIEFVAVLAERHA